MVVDSRGTRIPPKLTPEQERERARLLALVEAKVRGRFAIFSGSGEGRFMPDGTEEVSGHVIDEQGRTFFFWLEWDERLGAPVLNTWKQVEPQSHWRESREYREAREAVGLDVE